MKEYYKDRSDLEKLKFVVWTLIWGQCTEIVRKKLKALTNLQEKEKARDIAWLLRNLQKICSKIDDTRHPFITLYEMRKNLLLYRQQDDQTIAEYADELQSVYKTLHSIDGDLVPLQANNKEKILELYQEVTNEIVSEPIYENKIDSINS